MTTSADDLAGRHERNTKLGEELAKLRAERAARDKAAERQYEADRLDKEAERLQSEIDQEKAQAASVAPAKPVRPVTTDKPASAAANEGGK